MVRQIIIPASNTNTLNLPDEILGKEVEVLAFELQKETAFVDVKAVGPGISKITAKASDIFKVSALSASALNFLR